MCTYPQRNIIQQGRKPSAFCNMDEPWKYFAKLSQMKRANIVQFHLYDVPRIGRFNIEISIKCVLLLPF